MTPYEESEAPNTATLLGAVTQPKITGKVMDDAGNGLRAAVFLLKSDALVRRAESEPQTGKFQFTEDGDKLIFCPEIADPQAGTKFTLITEKSVKVTLPKSGTPVDVVAIYCRCGAVKEQRPFKTMTKAEVATITTCFTNLNGLYANLIQAASDNGIPPVRLIEQQRKIERQIKRLQDKCLLSNETEWRNVWRRNQIVLNEAKGLINALLVAVKAMTAPKQDNFLASLQAFQGSLIKAQTDIGAVVECGSIDPCKQKSMAATH